jgi:phenylacetate-CoA ligase
MIGLARQAMHSLRGSRRYALMREGIALQRLPVEELRRRQLARLVQVVHHAARTVPFYQDLLRSHGLKANDIRTFEDFACLPVLTKQDLRENLPRMLSSASDASRRVDNATGGSTGEPVRFYQDMDVFDAMQGSFMLGLTYAGWKPSDMIVNIWGNPRDKGTARPSVELKQWLSGSMTLSAYRYGRKEMDDWLEVLARFRRVFVYGYVSVLSDLAEHILACGRTPSSVCAVMTSAEKLHDHQRTLIAQAFGCRVHDQYGSREVPCIAVECEHGGMHLLTHSAYAEFLPEAGSELKRLVVTGLTNRTMPLLRYEIGDYATPLSHGCPCGRGFPLIRMDIGRIYDFMLAAGGGKVHGAYFVKIIKEIEGVLSFQFRQSVPGEVELLVTCKDGVSEESMRQVNALPQCVAHDHGDEIRLRVRFVDEIPRTIGGKHRYIVCEVQ